MSQSKQHVANPPGEDGTAPAPAVSRGGMAARLPRGRREVAELFFRFQSLFGLAVVVLLAIIFSPVRDGDVIFLDPTNLGNIIRAVSEIGILAVGMTFVIIAGGIDLSVGSVLGLAAVGTATLLTKSDMGLVTGLGTVLTIGLLFGLVQGVITAKVKLQAFIVTLAGLQAARGLARIWSDNQGVALTYGNAPQQAPPAFSIMTESIFGFLPFPAFLFLVIGFLGIWMLRTTTFARHVYAIGSNEKAARLSGIPVDRVKIAVFGISGLLAAFAGIVHAGQLNLGNPNAGLTYELDAIAAVVIGGTSLFGGRGSMVGSIGGALMLGVLDNILTLHGISENVQLVVTALVIVLAVALQQLRTSTTGR